MSPGGQQYAQRREHRRAQPSYGRGRPHAARSCHAPRNAPSVPGSFRHRFCLLKTPHRTWSFAWQEYPHCLTGCAIGEILGMAIGTALLWGNVPTMALAITLAFLFGYSFTLFAVRRAGLDLKSAIKVALAADTVSIAVMELVDNGIIALTPGAMDAHLSDGLFWSALLGGFAVAFLVTVPVNKWMIGRGKGHAIVHAHH
ncbi:DUF4396 domain-containing protein [Streptomyces sp. NBC_01604]|uniref:DUF4396 domain-containing protein n=1 Tax=unclassified Streptomyces TaxID=2593676 RepID=UPI00386F0A7B